MKHAIYTWEKRRESGEPMPREELLDEVNDYIGKRVNCSLATGYGTYIRNTPMRYSYKNGLFFLVTEGGHKFKGLLQNKNVSITIFDSDQVGADTVGITVEGTAVVTEFSAKDRKMSEARKFLITVKPTSIEYLNSELPERGYYQLQRLEFI